MASKREKFVIIDGNALIHRAFHALPPLSAPSGEVVNAVYGFTSILINVLKDIKPDYIAATFDLAAPTFRHTEYAEYKAHRVKAPDELYAQIPRVKEVVKAFNIPIFEQEGFEADDLIGTVTAKLKGKPLDIIIVTGDMDTLQLVDEQTKVYTLKKGVGETTVFGPAEVKAKYGITPDQMIDYKALRGDPSDNIPGVKGIGEKTAAEILQTFGSLADLYVAIESKSKKLEKIKPRILELLQTYHEDALLSYKLATIIQDVPCDFVLNDCAVKSYDKRQVIVLFQELGFKSLLTRVSALSSFQHSAAPAGMQQTIIAGQPKKHDAVYTVIDTEKAFAEFLKTLQGVHRAAVDTETTSLDVFDAKIVGVSIAWKSGEAYYINLHHKNGAARLKKLTPWLSSSAVEKIGHNMKYDYQILQRAGADFAPLTYDSMIASYLLNAGGRQHGLDALAFAEFGYEMQPITELIGKNGKDQITMDQVPVQQAGWYAAEDADFTWRLAEKLAHELDAKELRPLFENIEMPLVKVLADMELTGVKIDVAFLQKMSRSVKTKLGKIETAIYDAAGTQFNINSPSQLAGILFEVLKIDTQGISKTKTGISTRADELEKLRDVHPIVGLILEYRELAKLRSTYLEALPQMVKKQTGRVHTDFNQVTAATGRLSSINPNLQNIPVRTELGREIRKAFVADRGFRLVSADYSQLELRIAADLANDEKMLASFQKGEDIHTRTAADIHGIPLDEVTKDIRRTAKEVNFGVLYGMGVYGLASRTGISREKAREFIDKYFSVYKGIAAYIESTKERARKRGYVETVFGRRRSIPEINSSNHQLRTSAERMAVNMPIQGAEADLIKMAMITIARELPNVSAQSRMIMQVHDELVFEVPAAEVERVAAFVQKTMETVEKFRVPIVVDVSVGMNWGEMEKLGL